ncbi:hypothetical protein MTP04_17480 [Lysinibacillus sp. PLM2]|nr:hypothetical protein MTP04_17480 [Lysinibacillus sp. PLM2]
MKKYWNVLACSVASLLFLSACNDAASNSESIVQLSDLVNYQADDDYIDWQSDEVTYISLNNNTASVEKNTGVIISDNRISIHTSGTYVLSGTLSDGQIIVDAEDKGTVRLIFNGVSIRSTTSAPIYVKQADKTVISLEVGTENSLSDATEYVYEDENDEPDSTIFSKDDLTINGSGTLIVKGSFNDGISSNDHLLITGGTIQVEAIDDGIVGRDLFAMKNANITITSNGDGLKSSNDEDEEKGNVVLESGTLSIEAAGDGIQSEKKVVVVDGEFSIVAGGGSPETIESTEQFGMMGGGMGPGGMRSENLSLMIDQIVKDADILEELKAEIESADSNEELQAILENNTELQQLIEDSRQSRLSQQPPFGDMDQMNEDNGQPNANTEDFEEMQSPNMDEDNFAQMPEQWNPSDSNTTSPSSTDQSTEESTIEDTVSSKGIKAGTEINIRGGSFTIDSLDDAIHSNQDLSLAGGVITLFTGDDGIHADANVSISGGDISIEKSLEGIEGKNITITDGNIHVTAEDDGINVNVEESRRLTGMVPNQITNNDATINEGESNSINELEEDSGELVIEGGYLYVNANGDGLDSNSSIHMTGGTVLVYGPTSSGNGALDYGETFILEGGILVSAGSSGMAQGISENSTQNAIQMTFSEMQTAGTALNLENENGESIIAIAPEKNFQTVLISTPTIENGELYIFKAGGALTGENVDGLYNSYEYNNGTTNVPFEVSTESMTYLNEEGVTTNQTNGMFGGNDRQNKNGTGSFPMRPTN